MVIVNFIRDKEVGIFARAKRLGKSRSLDVIKGVNGMVCSGQENGKAGDRSDESESLTVSEEESDKSE